MFLLLSVLVGVACVKDTTSQRFCTLGNDAWKQYCFEPGYVNGLRRCNTYEPEDVIVRPGCSGPNRYSNQSLAPKRCVDGEWQDVFSCPSATSATALTTAANNHGSGDGGFTTPEPPPRLPKESATDASRNITTKPNTPGKTIVWFRNETTLLVLWQPPDPPGVYTHYKVSIVPPEARDSELFVEKGPEPPLPAQAVFKELVPGRAYNISVQTVFEQELSAPTTAQYRTVPLSPRNVSVPVQHRRETSFRVTWLPPLDKSDFQKYQVSVSGVGIDGWKLPRMERGRNEPRIADFEGLEPGARYTVTVKTVSGKVTSWPASAEQTLKPRPVQNLQWRHEDGGGVLLRWSPADGSRQDEYKVSYQEVGSPRDDSNTLTTKESIAHLSLLPGRKYNVTVWALSEGVESKQAMVLVALTPVGPPLNHATR